MQDLGLNDDVLGCLTLSGFNLTRRGVEDHHAAGEVIWWIVVVHDADAGSHTVQN
jgi:hypothetical protein